MINVFSLKAPVQALNYYNNYLLQQDEGNQQNINKLVIRISRGESKQFDEFQNMINKIESILEIEMSVDISESDQGYEILKYLVNVVIPKYKNTLKQITFNNFLVQAKDKKPQNLTQNYFLQILENTNLEIISFDLKLQEKGTLQSLLDFLQIFSKQSDKTNFMMLNIQIQIDKTSKKQQDSLIQMHKYLSYMKNLQGLSIDLKDLGLDYKQFQMLFQAISKMSKLKKLYLNLSNNHMTVTNVINCIQQLGSIQSNLESMIYIDSLLINSQQQGKYVQEMKKFQNLKELYLQGLSISQNSGKQFFSFFSSYHQLEKLNIDLYNNKNLNNEDFHHLFQSMKTLTNLHSIYLVFPAKKHFYSDKTNVSIALIDFLKTQENQLQSLQLEFDEYFEKQDYFSISEAICSLNNLKFLNVKIRNSSFQINQGDSENIWNQKNPDIFCTGQNDLICYLNNMILLKQSSEMESLAINYFENCEFKQEFFEKFTKMKSLEINIKTYYVNPTEIINVIKGLQIHSSGSLKTLIMQQKYLEEDQIFKITKVCKDFNKLKFVVYNLKAVYLKQLFEDNPFLQMLEIEERDPQLFFSSEHDKQICMNTNYLTEFYLKYYQQKKQNHLTSLRYSEVLQRIVYQKLIQPQIMYKPYSSHLDLVLN